MGDYKKNLSSNFQVSLLEAEKIDQAVAMFIDAFKSEAFTEALIDLSIPANYDIYSQITKYRLSFYLEIGHRVFTVLDGDKVIGMAILKSPHVKVPKLLVLRRAIPHLTAFARMLLLGMRASHLISAVNKPDNLPANHYTLEGFAVNPAYQGKGIARLLLEQIEQTCADDHTASGIYIVTGDENNKEIYQHFNYSIIEIRPTDCFIACHFFKKKEMIKEGIGGIENK